MDFGNLSFFCSYIYITCAIYVLCVFVVYIYGIGPKNPLAGEWRDQVHNHDSNDVGTPVNFNTDSKGFPRTHAQEDLFFSLPESDSEDESVDALEEIEPVEIQTTQTHVNHVVLNRKNALRNVYEYLQDHQSLFQESQEPESQNMRRLMSSSSFPHPPPPHHKNGSFNDSEIFFYNSSEPTFCPESDVLFLIEESDESSWNSSMIFIADVIQDIDIDGIRYGIIRYNSHSLVYLTFSASELMDKNAILQLITHSLQPSFDNDNTNNDDNDLAGALFEAFDLFDTDSDDSRQKVLITLTSGVPDSYIGNGANTCDDDLFPNDNNPFIADLVTFDIHHVLVVYGDPVYVDYGAVECLVSDTEEYMLTLPFGSINLGNDTNNEIKDFADDVADLTCFSPTTHAPSNQPTAQPTFTPTAEPTSFVIL